MTNESALPSVPSDGGAAEHEDGGHRHEEGLADVRGAREDLSHLDEMCKEITHGQWLFTPLIYYTVRIVLFI